MELACGDATVAFGMIYGMRNDPDVIDNDQLASVDHFFNAWTAQNTYNDIFGSGKISGILGTLAGWAGSNAYMFIKETPLSNFLPTDKPGSSPSPPSIAQWQWGHRGGDASSWYNTKMCIGSEEWKSFTKWLNDMT